jgi:putative addiction module component (TIGR02574 family)
MNNALLEQAVRLTPQEKIELIDALWESLQTEDLPLTSQQMAELDRRLDEFESNPGAEMSWEHAKKLIISSATET